MIKMSYSLEVTARNAKASWYEKGEAKISFEIPYRETSLPIPADLVQLALASAKKYPDQPQYSVQAQAWARISDTESDLSTSDNASLELIINNTVKLPALPLVSLVESAISGAYAQFTALLREQNSAAKLLEVIER